MIFHQKIRCEDNKREYVNGKVEVCFIDLNTKKPKKFPDDLLLIFKQENFMEEISVLNLFLQAGIVVKVVMILLFVASILSWIVIVERYKFFRKVKNENNTFLKKLWSGKYLST